MICLIGYYNFGLEYMLSTSWKRNFVYIHYPMMIGIYSVGFGL